MWLGQKSDCGPVCIQFSLTGPTLTRTIGAIARLHGMPGVLLMPENDIRSTGSKSGFGAARRSGALVRQDRFGRACFAGPSGCRRVSNRCAFLIAIQHGIGPSIALLG